MAQLYFYYSAMNAGKSTALLQSSYNYQERGMRTLVFTAEIDHRFGMGKVSSRIGLSSLAQLYNNDSMLYTMISQQHKQQPVHCVLLDESQFLTKAQVEQLCDVVDQLDIPVLCYGLRTDFLGELFIGSQYLLAWADKLVELKTICHCGRKANRVLRLDENGQATQAGEQVVIGGNESYVSVCRKHYKEAIYPQN
ncbi:thymidine kinase [Serratia symbiotica]|uniref:thymidine kinase n=1 Tax=Serratia symbiotica TaxID=138074 RepID=UPI0013259CA0|nr:thymidine kinase [Serratia symbiotica]MBF1994135.1 thymidine kinase [Serratia symbiotica]MBQ0956707.1 thymidine kinase [Serratia symbiotica]QTP15759.1 thymidine kinase [Serratia symbiotica]